METIQISKEAAQAAHKETNDSGKALLEKLIDKKHFYRKITDRIKTFEDACEYNNTNPLAKRFTRGTRNQIFQERVAEIVKALNEGWVPDWNDDDEYKYAPWFYLDDPCFRFRDSNFTLACSSATGGSRFAFKSDELATYAGKHFIKEYENWLTPDPASAEDVKKPASVYAPQPFPGDRNAWESHIMARVINFETACDEVGEDPADEKFGEGDADEIAYRKIKVVARALNGAWVPDWDSSSQAKWSPWFYLNKPGFRFVASICTHSHSNTAGGSRLCYSSEKLANYAAKQFLELYKAFLA